MRPLRVTACDYSPRALRFAFTKSAVLTAPKRHSRFSLGEIYNPVANELPALYPQSKLK